MGSQWWSRERGVRGVVLVCGALLTSFLAVPEPVPAQASGEVEPWLGCYALERDSWEPPLPENLRASDPLLYRLYQPPSRTELTADSAHIPSPGKMLHVRVERPEEPHPFSRTAWKLVGSDSVEIWWTNGFSGTIGHFAGPGDTLTGTLETGNDFGQPKHRTDAMLIAVPCSGSTASTDLASGPSETVRLAKHAYALPVRHPSRPPTCCGT